MSRGISELQHQILNHIRDWHNPKGMTLSDVMVKVHRPSEIMDNPYWLERVRVRANRTIRSLQRRELIHETKWCKTWGAVEYDIVRRFTLTHKGSVQASLPLCNSANRSMAYRLRKRRRALDAVKQQLASVMLFTQRCKVAA
ncbi:MAG: hypothetical protein WA867_22530 [Candidatus Acidiferrales bacterium]